MTQHLPGVKLSEPGRGDGWPRHELGSVNDDLTTTDNQTNTED